MSSRPASPRTALTMMTAMFFMWGFITSLNDVLIPHLKAVFSLNYAQSMLIQFTFFGAYFIMSLPSGKLVSRIGYRNSIIAGLVVTGFGALMFIPAAMIPSYPIFLCAFFLLATGITLLQVAANAYVSLLGEERLASSRLNLAQAFNSVGTTLAPVVGGVLILSGAALGAAALPQTPDALLAYRIEQAHMVQGPYLLLAGLLFLLALVVFFFHLPSLPAVENEHADDHTFSDALRVRHLRLGVIAIFLYVGAEVSIGSFLINFISLPGFGNMSVASAAKYVSFYWGGAMIGRFLGAALLVKVDPRSVLGSCALIAALLLLGTMCSHGTVAVFAIVAIGLFNSVMFPNIFTLGIAALGPLTGKASSLLIMAIVGGAVVPLLQGILADEIGVQYAFVLPLLCYLYIVFYGFHGAKLDTSGGTVDAPAGSAVL